MELNEKLKQLRKEKNWTQEQLAEQLFVSRTAISKWESGRGYPNIESLKSLSQLFSVSIDDLLSNEELLLVAETETRSDRLMMRQLVYALLDILLFLGMFLPMYGQPESGAIRAVPLVAYQELWTTKGMLSLSVFLIMGLLGLAELIMYLLKKESLMQQGVVISLSIHTMIVLLFSQAHLPYVTAYLFMLLVIKAIFLIKVKKE